MARFIGSNTLLGNGGVYQDVLQAGREDNIVGLVFSDQGGTLNIEHSTNGTDWDVNDSPITVAAGVGQVFSRPIYGAYVRLRYVNGATPQTVFRIQARFSSAGNR